MLTFSNLQNFISNLFKRYWWLTPIFIFLVWRLVVEIVGQSSPAAALILGQNKTIWWQWDSNWYGSIVHQGYSWHKGAQSNVTFFPLFPLLWRGLLSLTAWQSAVCAQIVSNFLALGSFIIFYYWVLVAFNKNIAWRALLALAVFPTSFFLVSVYSESTFLILVALVFLLAHKEKWMWAAAVAALASAARPPGIFLCPLLLWLWYIQTKKSGIRKWSDFFSLLVLPPLGLIFFSLYLWYQVGDPFAWFRAQVEYGRSLGVSPFRLIFSYIKYIIIGGENRWRYFFEILTMIFVGFSLPKVYRLNLAYSFFVLLNFVPSFFSNTFTSVQRFTLMLLPIFIVVAMQKRFVYYLYLLFSFCFLVFNILRFVNLRWAG